MGSTLTTRALNRTYLRRQLLIERSPLEPLAAVQHLVALQAQQARPPFLSLWTRLAGFERRGLVAPLLARSAVRATSFRATLHITTAADYLAFRSTVQPLLSSSMEAVLKMRGATLDLDAVLAAARRILTGSPLPFAGIRPRLVEEFPGADDRALGYAVRTCLPLATVPGDSEFAFQPDAAFAVAEDWLRAEIDPRDRMSDLVVRYLAAYGPASVVDAQTWTGIGKLKPVFEALRPSLRSYRSESGKELFDVDGAILADESEPAPVRFLPGFDHAVLGHHDRSRIIADEYRPHLTTKNLQVRPTFLVDGFVAGTWEVEAKRKVATVALTPFHHLTAKARKSLEIEGESLARFAAPESNTVAVRFEKC